MSTTSIGDLPCFPILIISMFPNKFLIFPYACKHSVRFTSKSIPHKYGCNFYCKFFSMATADQEVL